MQITVNTTEGLSSALASAHSGDTILLAAGSYTRLGLQGVSFSGSGVTITSADAANPATVAGVELSNCSGLTFSNLEITINARTQTAFNVNESSNIHLDGLDMHGPAGAQNAGLLFRNSTNVSVNDTDFHDLGTAVRNIDSSHVTVSGNRFKDLRSDGIQTTGTSNITITGNHLTDFHTAPGDHPDAIQFFTANQTVPVHDIVISDNVVVRGSGDIVQGIFMGNEADLPYVDVTISGNKIVGSMYNGIAIGMGQNLSITGNIVQAYADMGSWIRVEGSSNATIANNQSSQIATEEGNTGLTLSGNTTLAATTVGDTSILGHAPPPAYVAPSPPPADPASATPVASTPAPSGGSGAHTSQASVTDTSEVPQSVLQKVAGSTAPQAASGTDLKGSLLRGSDGGDTLTGAGANHELYGGAGNDSISGGEGRGYLRGEDGSDTIVGGADFDDINGNVGEDDLSGGGGDDWVVGGQGDDRLSGDNGGDLVYGNIGNDSASGGAGVDIVRGGQGNDTISGGDGDDWLSGDRGSDIVYGGAGADTFHFFAEAGTDVVKDFNAADGDRVQLLQGAVYDVAQVGADTVISIQGGAQMVLEGVNLSALKAGWLFGV